MLEYLLSWCARSPILTIRLRLRFAMGPYGEGVYFSIFFTLMPQTDKATFFNIVFWTFVLYTGGYLVLSLSYMFHFFSAMKMITARVLGVQQTASYCLTYTNEITFFPWVSL